MITAFVFYNLSIDIAIDITIDIAIDMTIEYYHCFNYSFTNLTVETFPISSIKLIK